MNAGGNSLGLGSSDNTRMLSLGSGLLAPQPIQISPNSGLTERFFAKGIPTIHLLNVRALCTESGIPFDPKTLPAIGAAAMYYGGTYAPLSLLALLLAAGGAAGFFLLKRREAKP